MTSPTVGHAEALAAAAPDDYQRTHAGVLRRLTPRRNRWADVRAFDDRATSLEDRQTLLAENLQELHARHAAAPAADLEALSAWQLAGARGARPEPTVEALERDIAAAQADYDSLTRAVARTLEEKGRYVAKHRARLKRDADRGLEEAHARAAGLVAELEQARAALIEAREEATWAALYPHEALTEPVESRLMCGGLMEPLKGLLGVIAQLDATRTFQALQADLDWIRVAASPAQKAALAGLKQRDLHGAVWADAAEGQEKIRDERRAARERHEAEWGLRPPRDA